MGSVGVTEWENNETVLVQSLGQLFMQVWALLLPASTRLLTVSFNALAGAVIPDSTGEYSHSQTPTLTLVAFHCTTPSEKTQMTKESVFPKPYPNQGFV